MEILNWDNVKEERMNDSLTRWAIHTPQMTIAKLHLKKGALVPMHRHVNAQTTWIQTGALLFKFATPDGEVEVIVRNGDVLPIPPDLHHSAEALEDTMAVDTFMPQRQDWIDGTDAYLRK